MSMTDDTTCEVENCTAPATCTVTTHRGYRGGERTVRLCNVHYVDHVDHRLALGTDDVVRVFAPRPPWMGPRP